MLKQVLFLMIIATNSVAGTYHLTVYNDYKNIYESESGVILISDNDCNLVGYKDIVLHTDSRGDYFSYLTTHYDAVDNELIEQEIVNYCTVSGYAGLPAERNTSSQAIFDLTSNILYLYNIELWENLKNTGDTIDLVQGVYEDGVLKIIKVE